MICDQRSLNSEVTKWFQIRPWAKLETGCSATTKPGKQGQVDKDLAKSDLNLFGGHTHTEVGC